MSLGSDFASSMDAQPGYDVGDAMSAYSAFPWVQACLAAIGTDLASLPVRVTRGRGKSQVVVEAHPFYDLFAQPTRTTSVIKFRRQLPVDLLLSGSWYCAMLGGARPTVLQRLHPERVKIVPNEYEGIGWFEYDGLGRREQFPAEDVLYVSLPSFEAGPEGLYGQGMIRALHRDLTVELQAQKLAERQGRTGRPGVVISPASDGDRWTEPQMRAVKDAYRKMLADDGAVVLGGGAKVDVPAWSPRDLEFEKVRLMARDAVLAAFSVPPTRVGLPTANYATAREQSTVYWQHLQGLAALVDDQLTRVALRFGPGVEVHHDFSRVDALQASRTERLARVQSWVLMGAAPSEAAAYEGFDDAPVGDVMSQPDATPADAPTDTPAARSVVARVFGLDGNAARAVEPMVDPEDDDEPAPGAVWARYLEAIPEDEDARKALADAFVRELQDPAERRMASAMRLFLAGQRKRVSSALEAQGEVRGLLSVVTRTAEEDALFQAIYDATAEAKALDAAMRQQVARAIIEGFKAAQKQLGRSGKLDPVRINVAVDEAIGSLIKNVDKTTQAEIRGILRAGLNEGATIAEMAESIRVSSGFGVGRALLVARTESTRSVNAGSTQAYRDAKADGVAVRKKWLSARDNATRDDHIALDAHPAIEPEAKFRIGNLAADAPGDFGDPAQDCNCRCTVVPVVER